MSRINAPRVLAKIRLVHHKPRFHPAAAAGQSVLPQLIIMTPLPVTGATIIESRQQKSKTSLPKQLFELMHDYSVGVFAVLVLIIAASGIQVGAAYWSAHLAIPVASSTPVHHLVIPAHGPNVAIPSAQLASTLQHITAEPLNIVVGTQTVPVGADTIKSWLQIVTDKNKHISYIHVKADAIGPSLSQITGKFAKAPVNQVTATYANGSSAVIVAGQNGVSVGDPSELAKQLAPNVLGGKGMQLNVPLNSVPFQAVTPAAFDKLLEVNIVTKQMYAYDKGVLTRSFPISAGAPLTPTPLGQFKIYEKLPVQTMTGLNADGSKYIQPNVHWINYFLPGGYAVHGNYWRPLSVFGAVNTSHGCVSLPDDEAVWVYNWAPIGTTVITHA